MRYEKWIKEAEELRALKPKKPLFMRVKNSARSRHEPIAKLKALFD